MKFSMKAVAASVLFAVAGGSQAAILNGGPAYNTGFDGELFISIVRNDASPESMIIDTGVSLLDLQAGLVTSWTSSAAQTAAIQGFLGTGNLSDFSFNAGGVTSQWDEIDFNNWDGFFMTVNPATTNLGPVGAVGDLLSPRSNIQTFTTQINQVYGSVASFANDGYVTGLIPGMSGFHYASAWGDNVGGSVTPSTATAVGTAAGVYNYYNASTEMFGFDLQYAFMGFLNIDATTGVATLGQGVSEVPVPAAAWLLGSGLVGLVGVARRRKA